MAHRRGGMCLELAAQLRIQKTQFNNTNVEYINLHFTSNSADYGEAIYVIDETYTEVCAAGRSTTDKLNVIDRTTECFIQVLSPQTTKGHKYHLVSIEFTPSDITKSHIYGGLLDRCTLDEYAEVLTKSQDQMH